MGGACVGRDAPGKRYGRVSEITLVCSVATSPPPRKPTHQLMVGTFPWRRGTGVRPV